MPGPTSSPIPAAAHQAPPVALTAGQCRSLLADLAHLADPATAAAAGTHRPGYWPSRPARSRAAPATGITDNDIDLAKRVEGLV